MSIDNSNKPAFPISKDHDKDSYKDGLTKREFFAANAGDPPTWFVHVSEPFEGTELPEWQKIKNKEDQNICRQWVYDGIFDLPEHLRWFSDLYEKNSKERKEWQQREIISKHFQWKTFYADELLKQLEK